MDVTKYTLDFLNVVCKDLSDLGIYASPTSVLDLIVDNLYVDEIVSLVMDKVEAGEFQEES